MKPPFSIPDPPLSSKIFVLNANNNVYLLPNGWSFHSFQTERTDIITFAANKNPKTAQFLYLIKWGFKSELRLVPNM